MEQTEQSNDSLLSAFFRHNLWANLRLLDYCANLSDEQLDTSAIGVYGSIRNTLEHYLSSEVDYVNILTGKWPEVIPTDEQFAGFAVLQEGARWSGAKLLELALKAKPGDIVRVERPDEPIFEYPYTSFMTQLVNHSTEHRTQISAIITQLGLQPPSMTGWAFMRSAGEFHEYEKPTQDV